MPLYYFDIDDTETYTRDDTGVDLDDDEAARRQAIGSMPQIASDILPDHGTRHMVCTVKDEDRRPILSVSMSIVTIWLNHDR